MSMPSHEPLATYDPLVTISDQQATQQLGDAALLGNWFVFLKTEWLIRSGMAQLLSPSSITQTLAKPNIIFRGKEPITLPGAKIMPTPLPRANLISLTCDKALYRVKRDTIHLLIAAPQHANEELRLTLTLSGNPYANYPLTVDQHGLCLWSLRDLPEGVYSASLYGLDADECRFEVADYRLAALNTELVEQQLHNDILHYTLSVTAFNQPYSGGIEVELQVDGQRVGQRKKSQCDSDGQCRDEVKLAGNGLHTLNIIVGERTATVVLKGAQQQRRETLTISELGEVQQISLLPLPEANRCRGLYVGQVGTNTEPFMVQNVVGSEVTLVPRTGVEVLRTIVINPTQGTSEEHYYEQLQASQVLRLPVPQPYGIVLLGAFIDGRAWEGWCAILHPSAIQLECIAPKEAKPGSRVTITLKTAQSDRAIPVQLIVKDQRLIAPSDPQTELAAAIKKNMSAWNESAITGTIERKLMDMEYYRRNVMFRAMAAPAGMPMAMSLADTMTPTPTGALPPPVASMPAGGSFRQPTSIREKSNTGALATQATSATATTSSFAELTKVRMQFPEVIHNTLVNICGEAQIEVTLGDSMTHYTVEAFALSPDTLDWQRAETTITAQQAVYAEMTVSPFVFPGDPVLGRLDVGATSGKAIVEVQHDSKAIPLFFEDGAPVVPGSAIPSGSVVRFPVRPGMFTATVRDAETGEVDVSERHVTVPGQLRHIMRRTRLLNPGDVVTLQEAQVLELKPLPGLERPFQTFVEGASQYVFGCVEQTSCKLLAMYLGYSSNQDKPEVAREYEAALVVWHKRLQSMYLPQSGFCFYPPAEGGNSTPDTHYAPKAVKHLFNLLTVAERSAPAQGVLREIIDNIAEMVQDAATYYKIAALPKTVSDCHDAYQVITSKQARPQQKVEATNFVRTRLKEHQGQMYIEVSEKQPSYLLHGMAVSRREETAYAAAALFATGERSDLLKAVAATNYITGQINEEHRLYSTVDSSAALALLLELRNSGILTNTQTTKVRLNGQDYTLKAALDHTGRVESLQCVEGLLMVQVTSEVIENWSAYKGQLAVEVHLERRGKKQRSFKKGDELELVINVPRYEPGLLVHVCLPDALARVVGGGQVKRFSLDFCEKNVLRVPLAAVGSTVLPQAKEGETRSSLLRWLGIRSDLKTQQVQHWAVIVRNMFREEQVGNPGLLEVTVE